MFKIIFTKKIKESTMCQFYKAFTLAEVLITLGVIGVVAAITIPVLLSNYQERDLIVKYKKAYSVAQNAVRMAIAKNESFVSIGTGTDGAAGCQNWDVFSSQFKKAKECVSNDADKCWDMAGEKSNNAPELQARAFIDNSGFAWTMRGSCSNVSADVSFFLVDINALKPPNKFGKDRWAIMYKTDSANVPVGILPIPYAGAYYVDGDVNIYFCPTGGCLYRGWLTDK